MGGFSKAKWTTALFGALLLPFLSACQQDSASLAGIVEELADEAGSDRVARIQVELIPDEGLKVTAAFLTDSSAVQYVKRPGERRGTRLGSPTPRVPMNGVALTTLDLDALEQRLRELPECDEPRAEVLSFGTHVAEHVRCGYDGIPTGMLDGDPVSPIPVGDLPAAAEQLRADAALLDATHVGRVMIVMDRQEVWTQVQVLEPALPASNGEPCAMFMTRARGSMYPQCEVDAARFPVDALDPEAITRIWRAEGEPTSGWQLELVSEDDPRWLVTAGKESRRYTLAGDRA